MPSRNLMLLLAVAIIAVGVIYFFVPGEEAPQPEPEPIPAPADVAAIPPDATVNEAGIGIRIIQEGDGVNFPALSDDVTIHYTGWTTDGEMFDSSRLRGEPSTFPLGELIEGWKLSVPSLSKGGRALIWIPGELAYDRPDARPDAPRGMLVFDIELFDFAPTERPPE